MFYDMVQFKTNPTAASPPERCPNGHELKYPNVINAHWPKQGSGKLTRAWHCLTCKATNYDD